MSARSSFLRIPPRELVVVKDAVRSAMGYGRLILSEAERPAVPDGEPGSLSPFTHAAVAIALPLSSRAKPRDSAAADDEPGSPCLSAHPSMRAKPLLPPLSSRAKSRDLLCAFLPPPISTELQDRLCRGTFNSPPPAHAGEAVAPPLCHPERSRGICCAPFSLHRFLQSSRIGYAEEPSTHHHPLPRKPLALLPFLRKDWFRCLSDPGAL